MGSAFGSRLTLVRLTQLRREVLARLSIFGKRSCPRTMSDSRQRTAARSRILVDRIVIGCTDDGEAVSMRMTCAEVHKVLGSVHRMNRCDNRVVLDGDESHLEKKHTQRRTKIHYEHGQYIPLLVGCRPTVSRLNLKSSRPRRGTAKPFSRQTMNGIFLGWRERELRTWEQRCRNRKTECF